MVLLMLPRLISLISVLQVFEEQQLQQQSNRCIAGQVVSGSGQVAGSNRIPGQTRGHLTAQGAAPQGENIFSAGASCRPHTVLTCTCSGRTLLIHVILLAPFDILLTHGMDRSASVKCCIN